MGIVSRVNRLERAMGLAGPCPVCNDEGFLRVSIDDEPVPEGCPCCGSIIHVRLQTLTDAECAEIRTRNWGDVEFAP